MTAIICRVRFSFWPQLQYQVRLVNVHFSVYSSVWGSTFVALSRDPLGISLFPNRNVPTKEERGTKGLCIT